MSAKRKLLRANHRKVASHKGPCWKADDGCRRRGKAKMECKLCISKGARKPFTLQTCADHAIECREKLKKHILRRHPGAIPAWMIATLAGKDMR